MRQTRAISLGLLALAASGACTWEQKAYMERPDRETTWKDEAIDPRDEDKKDVQELAAIERRIGRGELPKITFDFDSDVIRETSYRTLDVVADWLLRHPDRKIRIRAHTCTIGTKEYNDVLSEKRAKSVKQYLVAKGVPPPSIRYKGVGYSEPLVDNSTEENREKNRRVEFQLVYRD